MRSNTALVNFYEGVFSGWRDLKYRQHNCARLVIKINWKEFVCWLTGHHFLIVPFSPVIRCGWGTSICHLFCFVRLPIICGHLNFETVLDHRIKTRCSFSKYFGLSAMLLKEKQKNQSLTFMRRLVSLKSALTLCLAYDNWVMRTIRYLPFFVLHYIVDKTSHLSPCRHLEYIRYTLPVQTSQAVRHNANLIMSEVTVNNVTGVISNCQQNAYPVGMPLRPAWVSLQNEDFSTCLLLWFSS